MMSIQLDNLHDAYYFKAFMLYEWETLTHSLTLKDCIPKWTYFYPNRP